MRKELVIDALQMAVAPPPPRARSDSPQRPGIAIRLTGLRPGRPRCRHLALDGLQRRLLRQRRRRELLRHAQERTRPPPLLADPPRAHQRGLRIHRSLLQPRPPPLHARDARARWSSRTALSAITDRASPLRGSGHHRIRPSTTKPESPTLSGEPGELHPRSVDTVPCERQTSTMPPAAHVVRSSSEGVLTGTMDQLRDHMRAVGSRPRSLDRAPGAPVRSRP